MGKESDRERLKKAHEGDKKWAKKVDEMSDQEVTAVLRRLKTQIKI